MAYLHVKRGLDIIFSIIFLIMLSPALLLIAIFVLAFSGRPITYHHKRAGKDGKMFTIHKFRTMVNGARELQKKIPEEYEKKIRRLLKGRLKGKKLSEVYLLNKKDKEWLEDKQHRKNIRKISGKKVIYLDDREWKRLREIGRWRSEQEKNIITFPGKYLRITHLDELLQLTNILKGDMSFIGPRAQDYENYRNIIRKDKRFRKIYSVKPGLSGMGSVLVYLPEIKRREILKEIGLIKGMRSEEANELYMKEGLYYAENRSFWLDLEILLWTFYEEIYSFKRALMKDF